MSARDPNAPGAIMIFAAGFGTRMGALTQDRPKPLIEVAGRPLIDYAMDMAAPMGLPIVVNTHYKSEMVAEHLAGKARISEEQPQILETGGGLKQALPLLPDAPVYTLNSDAVWAGPNPLEVLRDLWEPDRMEALVLLVALENTVGFTRPGDFSLDRSGALARSPKGLIYTGAQLSKPGRVRDTPDAVFSFNKLWDEMISEGTLFGAVYPGRWADVGTPAGITLAEEMIVDV